MASGLGKTYTAVFDVQAFEKKSKLPPKILYLAHQHVILAQARRSFENVLGSRQYGRYDGEVHDRDADVLFATFQSMANALSEFEPTYFDYIIVDEAHHGVAPTRERVLNHFNPKFYLGLTATPNRTDGQDIFEFYNDTTAIYLPLERAVSEGMLSPIDYRVFSDAIDSEVLRLILADKSAKSIRSHFRARVDADIRDVVLQESAKLFTTPKVIVFCQTVEQMHSFAKLFPRSATISGRDSRATQLDTVRAFSKGETAILLARDVLNEGVDVPDANTIVFLRNTESPVIFLQQLGRGLRKSEGKDRVLVLDFVDNVDHFIFVYALISKIQAEQRRLQPAGSLEFAARIDLDQVAREVISAVIRRKEEKNIVFDLAALSGALDHKVGIKTLQNMVKLGLLVPDFSWESTPRQQKHYLERATMRRFLSHVHSMQIPEGLLHERTFAASTGKSIKWLHLQEKTGRVPAAWVHIRGNGRVEFYYHATSVV
jgi:type I site-specific restriction endonuclease